PSCAGVVPFAARSEDKGMEQVVAKGGAARAGSNDPMLGKVVAGRYRLEARLGEGGMGVVYRARHVLIERVVALKLIRPDLRGETHLRAWMLREARAANRVVDAVGGARFAQHPCAQVRFSPQIGPDQLEGDDALDENVASAVDHAHPALAEPRFQPVPPRHHLAEHRIVGTRSGST